jgi:DNA-binding NtrC family response regulator
MNVTRHILVASPDLASRRALVAVINEEGYSTITVARVRDCQDLLQTHDIRMIFCDRRLADGTYRDVLAAAGTSKLPVPVVVNSRLAGWEEYREVLREGAWDLIACPCHPVDVLRILGQLNRDENLDLGRVAEPRLSTEIGA